MWFLRTKGVVNQVSEFLICVDFRDFAPFSSLMCVLSGLNESFRTF